MTRFWDIYESPIGPLTLISSDLGLTGIAFSGRDLKLRTEDHEPALLEPAAEQLEQYFNGERRSFELELDVTGSAFQVSIWQRLLEIPYGATISYSQLAEAVDRLDIVRAVAAVVGRTPVPIVIPCHRVVGADGSLTGYGGGLDRKRDLLQLESSGARQLSLL
jgi:methylated-DNA-[protein]-cysteine S-methyltransferase